MLAYTAKHWTQVFTSITWHLHGIKPIGFPAPSSPFWVQSSDIVHISPETRIAISTWQFTSGLGSYPPQHESLAQPRYMGRFVHQPCFFYHWFPPPPLLFAWYCQFMYELTPVPHLMVLKTKPVVCSINSKHVHITCVI